MFEKPFALAKLHQEMRDRTYHVYPNSEQHVINGFPDERCWCEPAIEVVDSVDGGYGWIVIHNQLQ